MLGLEPPRVLDADFVVMFVKAGGIAKRDHAKIEGIGVS
jgi:hypothetical protein